MTNEVVISREPLSLDLCRREGCGAVATFHGIVRRFENGLEISAIDYEAYIPMAEMEMRSILEKLQGRHGFSFGRVHHRIGVVPVGEAAIIAEIHAPHRREAFGALMEFMDLLKKDVPIWKVRTLPV